MLIDDVTIKVKAGNGGDGKVAFNTNMMSLGPVGGTGGNGGDVIALGVNDIGLLLQFRHKKDWKAEHGGQGRGQFIDGPDGEDLILKVPIGTVVHNLDTNESTEITEANQQVRIAKGGHGGKGNFHFRSSINTSPKEFEPGTAGEQFNIRLELKLIADVGLIGLPNVGKSSLLNELTRAKSKVANYQFTTLEPHLGAYYGLILADIPGLIEGASSGKGLGIKFLRHVERTRILLHCIAADSETVADDYDVVKNELKTYNTTLAEKEEYILLTRSDMVSEKELNEKMKILKKKNKNILPLSIHDMDQLDALKKLLNGLNKN